MTKWMPIDTAPKTGIPILCWQPGWAYPKICFWVVIPPTEYYEGSEYWEIAGVYNSANPTHWLPLPQIPEEVQ